MHMSQKKVLLLGSSHQLFCCTKIPAYISTAQSVKHPVDGQPDLPSHTPVFWRLVSLKLIFPAGITVRKLESGHMGKYVLVFTKWLAVSTEMVAAKGVHASQL